MDWSIADLMRGIGISPPAPIQYGQPSQSRNLAQMMGPELPRRADPLDFSNQYNTPIPANKLPEFNQWVADQTRKTGKSPLGDRYDYDVNGFFLSGNATAKNGHMTDEFKKPNHPTFSEESKYHGVNGNYGGKWITAAGGSEYYEPSPLNVKLHGIGKLKQYFQQAEPSVTLLAPPQPPQVMPQ